MEGVFVFPSIWVLVWFLLFLIDEGEGGGYNLMRELDINQVPSNGNINEEEISIEEEEESCNINVVNGGRTRKKLRLTKEQSFLLEESFRQNHTLNPVRIYIIISISSFVFFSSFCWVFNLFNLV